ncbi:hypothetical protein BWGOE13_55260 [Bacillus mycoides]|uniref:Uncharacterized protein n=2 Tax=Bacillus mycoides TaxID=1405 RepID=A0A1E8BLT2_BACMY|nr:hypothetical protein BWGOE11_34230 [Bacillus mycoides]OFD91326.1 hypothetical protein BWGOE13_55260 [Bacillus mycoides]
MIGTTDYSHQSLSDMFIDLEKWIKGITETQQLLHTTIDDLSQNGHWSQCDFDFRSLCGYTIKFFDTAINDLKEVMDGIYTEIKEYHIKILFSLAKKAHEIYDHAKKVWSEYSNKAYGDPIFKKIESLDYEICNMTGDMFDINNLAHRLGDFIGRKVNGMGNEAKVTNIFKAPVNGGIQQNFDNSIGIQNIGSNTTELERLKDVMLDIKELLKDVPKENREEIEDSIIDLEEVIQNNDAKKSKLRAFGGAIIDGLKKLFTVQAIESVEKISTKLPQVIENFEKALHKIIGS